MWANNETGMIFPIKELAQIAHERGVLFHADVTQAVGKLKVDVRDVDVDFKIFQHIILMTKRNWRTLYKRCSINSHHFFMVENI